MTHPRLFPGLGRLGGSVRLGAATIALALLGSGCATHLLRYDEPARQEDVALSARDDKPDLVLLDVVSGVLPKDRGFAVVEIPFAGGGPPRLVHDEDARTSREELFATRKPSAWTRERRAKENLLLPKDLAEGDRRNYRVRSVRAKHGFELVVARTQPAPAVELARIPLPKKLTPSAMSVPARVALGIPLAAIDLAWIPITAASFVLLLPFGSWVFVDELLDDEVRW